MRKILLILSVLVFLISCKQSEKKGDKQYYFQDIGFHITIPKAYESEDTFPQPSFTSEDGKQITDPVQIKELEADLMKPLLSVYSSELNANGMGFNNSAGFNLALRTTKTGDFEQYYAFHKNMQFVVSEGQMVNIDTLSSTLKVGNITFRKFLASSTKKTPVQCSGIYVAPIKNYFLVVKVDYTDKKFGDDLEKAILTAKFD